MDDHLPLFVLPMVLFPGELQELRVFEPRYRQMLDTCILDERPFGLVNNDPFNPVNGWDGPRSHGCEAMIVEHQTKGMNHFITIQGGRRFIVQDVIAPALPPFTHPTMESLVTEDGAMADVEALLNHIGPDHAHHRLYISATVAYIEEHNEELTEAQNERLRGIVHDILNRVGEGMNIDAEVLIGWVNDFCNEHITGQPASIYHVASLLLNTNEARQQVLSSTSPEEALRELELHIGPRAIEEE